MPHHDPEHSEYALMIRDRPPTTYFWQRAPTNLKVRATLAYCLFTLQYHDITGQCLILVSMFDRSSQVYHVFAGRGGSLLLSEEAPGFGSSLLDGEVSG